MSDFEKFVGQSKKKKVPQFFYTVNKSVIAILSGGIDSTSMLWHLQNSGYNILKTVTFDYGQKHKKEIKQVPEIVKKFNSTFNANVTPEFITLDFFSKMGTSALTGKSKVPKNVYNPDTQKITVVPNRNMIFISIAVGKAIDEKISNVAYAAHTNDHAVYPDCRPEFVDALQKAITSGNWASVRLLAPFINSRKEQIVRLAVKYGTPLELTWSCYEGNERPCLACGTCIERTNAFVKAGTSDPILDEDEWQNALRTTFSTRIKE